MKKVYFYRICLFLTVTVLTYASFSQEALKSTEEEYYDFLSIQGITIRPSLNYRTLSDSEWNFTEKEETAGGTELSHPWQNNNLGSKRALWQPQEQSESFYLKGVPQGIFVKLYGPEWYNSYNTAAPYGQNDGALWQGKGYNTSLTAGVRLEAYGLELTVKPQLCWQENREFDIMPSNTDSEYGYFWGYGKNIGCDAPQRFGDSSFWTFDWGDTEIRYTWHTLTVGFGTQSIWLGPAYENPVLHSNNAPSYPKFDIGIRKQRVVVPGLNWNLGEIEGRIWIGYLTESDYFDTNSDNNHNMINGFAVAYSPSFIPGMTISVNKVCLCKWDDRSIKYFNPFYNSNEIEDQKASFGIDWIFPQVGFEVYGELGIDDYMDFQTYIERTLTYTVGLKKSMTISSKKSIAGKLYFEWNNSEMSQDFQFQWPYNFGFHHIVTQGYTNKGQWIGSGIGYGGNNQILGFSLYHKKGFINLFFQRGNPDLNYIFSKAVNSSAKDNVLDGFPVKSYINIGGTNSNYITKDFIISESFVFNKIRRPHYKNDECIYNCYFQLSLKYIF
ncbi:MAG: capsule assembly Wzi family protein [Spirochaetia bacterium]|nr:capsule assembly Wzi family protein [Spirochaetia bacterium]